MPAKRFLLSVIKFLQTEKLCSDGTLVAGIDKKFLAILARFGYWFSFAFHHSSGSIFSPKVGEEIYPFASFIYSVLLFLNKRERIDFSLSSFDVLIVSLFEA